MSVSLNTIEGIAGTMLFPAVCILLNHTKIMANGVRVFLGHGIKFYFKVSLSTNDCCK